MRTPVTSTAAAPPHLRWTALFGLTCATVLLLHPASGSAQQRPASGEPVAHAGWIAPAATLAPLSPLHAVELLSPAASEDSAVELKDANVAARFLLEIGALGALGYWGVRRGESRLTRIALGVGVPLSAAVVWGTFASPQAPVTLAPAPRLALQTAIFGASAAALADAGHPRWAVGFAAAVLVNTALLIAWDQ